MQVSLSFMFRGNLLPYRLIVEEDCVPQSPLPLPPLPGQPVAIPATTQQQSKLGKFKQSHKSQS